MTDLWVCHLGQIDYRAATELQEQLRERVLEGDMPEVLLLLEHPPTYTLGRRSEPGDLPLGEEWCRAQGIEVVRTSRGGRLTYHGPGQLVGYPIMHVDNVLRFVHTMQDAIVAALAQEGVSAETRDGREYIGAWVGERKIASIGIHLHRGVSAHGFAINVDNDLAPFEWAVACGLPDVAMTSVERETGRTGTLSCFRKRVAYAFCQAHGRRQRLVTPERLAIGTPVGTLQG